MRSVDPANVEQNWQLAILSGGRGGIVSEEHAALERTSTQFGGAGKSGSGRMWRMLTQQSGMVSDDPCDEFPHAQADGQPQSFLCGEFLPCRTRPLITSGSRPGSYERKDLADRPDANIAFDRASLYAAVFFLRHSFSLTIVPVSDHLPDTFPTAATIMRPLLKLADKR